MVLGADGIAHPVEQLLERRFHCPFPLQVAVDRLRSPSYNSVIEAPMNILPEGTNKAPANRRIRPTN